MAQKNNKQVEVTPALKYFFAVLEKSKNQKDALNLQSLEPEQKEIDQIEAFVRSLKTQNIFIYTVGMSGKSESTILSKAIFSLNKVVKIYYSTSFDEHDSGFIRVRADMLENKIVVERLHGYRPVAERMYSSSDQCHVIRYLTQWLVKRIDWQKTKINTLDLYDAFVIARLQDQEAELYDEDHWMELQETH